MMVALLSDSHHIDLIVKEARSWIGTPYQHQASLKAIGCDCLGLVRGVWREVYVTEPEQTPAYSSDWAEAGGREQLYQAARRHMPICKTGEIGAGELLIFRWRPHLPAKHLAITTSCQTMIHAQQNAVVCEVPINNWWRRHIAYRFSFPFPNNDFPKGVS